MAWSVEGIRRSRLPNPGPRSSRDSRRSRVRLMNQPSVFISCVSPELRQTRSRVAAILTRLGYTPVFQEIFGTEPGDSSSFTPDRRTKRRGCSLPEKLVPGTRRRSFSIFQAMDSRRLSGRRERLDSCCPSSRHKSPVRPTCWARHRRSWNSPTGAPASRFGDKAAMLPIMASPRFGAHLAGFFRAASLPTWEKSR